MKEVQAQEVTLAPCGECTRAKVTNLEDDDDALAWWVWLLIGLGALLLCCLIALMWCLCCRKKTDTDEHHKDVDRENSFGTSESDSYPEAGKLGQSPQYYEPEVMKDVDTYSDPGHDRQESENPIPRLYPPSSPERTIHSADNTGVCYFPLP